MSTVAQVFDVRAQCTASTVVARWPLAALLLALLTGSTPSFAAPAISHGDDVTSFKFQAPRWPKDTALVYRKTQIGIHALDSLTTLYFDPQYNLQALKLLRGARRPLVVDARFNWTISSPVSFDSWSLPRIPGEKPRAVANFDMAKRIFTITLTRFGTKPIRIDSLPFHVHDFELMSLGAAMRFLESPEKPFTFELIGLDRKDRLYYKDSGRILVNYDGRVYCREMGTRQCREYVMLWADTMEYFGRVQIDAQNGDMVLLETVVPDSADIKSIRMQLVRRLAMTPGDWKRTLERSPAALRATYRSPVKRAAHDSWMQLRRAGATVSTH